MSVISLAIEVAKLAILAIILFYVVEQITAMPVNIRRVVQGLIILIVVLTSIQLTQAGSSKQDKSFLMDRAPSIVAPERH